MSREFEQRYILGPDPRVLQYRDRQGDHQSAASRSTWPEERVVAAPTIKPLRFSISAWPMKHNRASLLGLRAATSLSNARSRSGNSPKDRSPSVPLPEIDERVHAFLDRPLAGEWPYLWLDATYLKQREGGRIVAVAAIIAVAANSDGRREIVGLHIGPSEAETQERLAQCSCHHAPASADSDRADGGSRRRRAEYLSLLRRAYGHRRDFRTRLPAATVAQSSNRLRQFMTSTLLPPSHIAAPVPGRYLIADGHPPPTATVGAAFGRQKAERSLQDHRSDPAHGDQTQRRGDYSTVVPVRNRKIRARTDAKSP